MGANLSSFQPEMQNDKKPLPLGFLSKTQGADGFLTFLRTTDAAQIREPATPCQQEFSIFFQLG